MKSSTMQSWTIGCVLVLVGCSGSSATNGAGSGVDGGDEDANVSDAGPAVDPRQVLRDESIFKNLDFEDVDGDGVPSAWTCGCLTGAVACKTSTAHPEHGLRSLVLPSGCYAYQSTTAFDATKGVRFDYFGQGATVLPAASYLIGFASDGTYEPLYTNGFSTAPTGWTDLLSMGDMPMAGWNTLQIWITNTEGENDYPVDGHDLEVDDVIAVQDAPNPPPKVGSLLRATHYDQFGVVASATPGSIYLSLPIDWASQTPLYFELTVDPPSILDHVVYANEAEGNWGATLYFAANQAAPSVVVKWDSVVLERAIPDAELPTVFAAASSPDQWLSASSSIESTDTNIVQTAAGLVPPGSSPLDTMLGVIGWTSKNVTYGFPTTADGFDATSAYNFHETTCTGYANLSSAMGRSLGVPTRHVTNILVGESQEMHSISEFYLGPTLGWRRVEPQGTAARVPDDYGFIMRLVLPSDESPVAGRNGVEGELLLGIPFHEFTETLTGANTFTVSTAPIDTFSDCRACENHSDPQSVLRDTTPDAMAALFSNARTHWQSALAEYNAGGLPSTEMATRRNALTAQTMADVSAILGALP